MTAEPDDGVRRALAAARLGEWSWDVDTDLVTLSPHAAEIYALAAGPVVTWTAMAELLHPEDRTRARRAVEAVLAGDLDYIIEYRLINGARERWIAVTGRGRFDAAGRPLGMAGVVHDRTREHLLAVLDDRLRPMSEARAITAAATELLGRALNVGHCAYAIVDADPDVFTIVEDFCRGMPSLAGRHRLSEFGPDAVRTLRAGQPFVLSDLHTDPRLGQTPTAAFDRNGIASAIAIPIHKNGRLVAVMAVHHATPRTWSEEEVQLVQAVASRCWESLERARIEDTLRENEDRYRALLQSAGHIFWTADPNGCVTQDSTSWRAFTGQTEAQWRGEGWLDALHPDDRERVRRGLTGAVDRGMPLDTEYRLRHRDGRWRWTAVRVVPIRNADGSLREWFGMNTDITERKSAERRDAFLVRLDDATRPLNDPPEIALMVLRLLCEELGADRATYFEIDDDGYAGTVLADYAPRLVSLQGRVFPLEDYGSDFAQAVRTGAIYRLEDASRANPSPEELARFNAIQIVAELMVPLHKAGALRATLGLFQGHPRDWQEDEIQLCRLVVQRGWESLERARIEREVRLADRRKDEFIATLAHELRNPLAPIRNSLALLQRVGEVATRSRLQGVMERQVEHLVRMVDELLDVSRINRGMIDLQREDVDLREALRNALETARPGIESARHCLDIDLPEVPVWVRGDPVRLTQVFANLLNNAAKYTADGGHLRVRLHVDAPHAVIEVADNGIGIPPTMLHEIFETFAQTPEGRRMGRGGLGIGLSLVRRLVALHGGQVKASSEGPGTGSRFEVRLLHAATPEPASVPLRENDSASARRGRILIVDDNRDAADSLAELLRWDGWEVEVAYDGSTALRQIDQQPPDLTLLDLGMPEMDGFEVARRLRQSGHEKLILIALTGWGQSRDRQLSQAAGFDHHLVKPVDPQTLSEQLIAWLAEGARPAAEILLDR